MVVIAINARGKLWSPADRDPDGLWRALEALAPGRPVPILVHGFRYAPGAARDDPHRLILSPGPVRARGVPSWPRHLGFRGQAGEGHDLAGPGRGGAGRAGAGGADQADRRAVAGTAGDGDGP
jgi:hypothetical protein